MLLRRRALAGINDISPPTLDPFCQEPTKIKLRELLPFRSAFDLQNQTTCFGYEYTIWTQEFFPFVFETIRQLFMEIQVKISSLFVCSLSVPSQADDESQICLDHSEARKSSRIFQPSTFFPPFASISTNHYDFTLSMLLTEVLSCMHCRSSTPRTPSQCSLPTSLAIPSQCCRTFLQNAIHSVIRNLVSTELCHLLQKSTVDGNNSRISPALKSLRYYEAVPSRTT